MDVMVMKIHLLYNHARTACGRIPLSGICSYDVKQVTCGRCLRVHAAKKKTKEERYNRGISAVDAVERLAEKKSGKGDCPPEDLRSGLEGACDVTDDCRLCWRNTVADFLELENNE